jgi:DNA-binding MarR family transcriptional regulator
MEPSTADELAEALRTIYRRIGVYRDEMLQVTPKELGLLQIIAERGPIRVKDLAQAISLPLSTVSWTADRMVGRKLLARKADPRDRRAILLTLTRTGRGALKAHDAVFDLVAKTSLTMLDPDEGRLIVRAIRRLADHFS